MKLIERMRGVGLQVDVRTLFATPTLAKVAASVGPKADVCRGSSQPDPECWTAKL